MSDIEEEIPAAVDQQVDLLPEEPALQLPGDFLRQAREARKMTVFEVAQSLKFGPRQIEALEADNYAVLPPGNTFLRGFVRGYSKLLKLDPDTVLAMLDARAPALPPDVRAPQNMGVAATPIAAGRRSSRPMVLGSAVLVIVAAALGAWHFLSQPLNRTESTPPAPAGVPIDGTVVSPEVRVEQAPATAIGAPTASAPIPVDMHQLVFTFTEKSWVEVKDATQRIVFSAENQPGTRQAVVGKPPFQVVIGNATQVEVQYDDRQIDLKPHIRAEVARLTIE